MKKSTPLPATYCGACESTVRTLGDLEIPSDWMHLGKAADKRTLPWFVTNQQSQSEEMRSRIVLCGCHQRERPRLLVRLGIWTVRQADRFRQKHLRSR